MFFFSQVMRPHQVRKICIRGLLITHYFASYLDCKSLRNVFNDGSDTYVVSGHSSNSLYILESKIACVMRWQSSQKPTLPTISL